MPSLDIGCRGTCGWNRRDWWVNKHSGCCRSHTFTISNSERSIGHCFSPNATSLHHIIDHRVVRHRKEVEKKLLYNSAKRGTPIRPTAASMASQHDSEGSELVSRPDQYYTRLQGSFLESHIAPQMRNRILLDDIIYVKTREQTTLCKERIMSTIKVLQK